VEKSEIFLVGIDEAGRGPLAGPMCMAGVLISKSELYKWGRIKDSKKLSESKREKIFKKIKKDSKDGKIKFSYYFMGAKSLDKYKMTLSSKISVERVLSKLVVDKNVEVLLDGSLFAPKEYKKQKTIIKGDEKETVIALASIVAKVVRDRKMVNLSKKYPKYGFEVHKGYGTKKHIEMIKKYGFSDEHRRLFLKNFAQSE
jgi:ribonuclease HII